MGLDLDRAASDRKAEAGAPETKGIFCDPFWRAVLDGQRLPGEDDVPDRIAEAIAIQISRFTHCHVPVSECKAVVALIALAVARDCVPIFEPSCALRNLRKLDIG